MIFSNGTAPAAGSNYSFTSPQGDYALPVCYGAGSKILTSRGEVAVEDLRVGDLVLNAAGEARPIRWLGHRTVDCTRHPHPDSVQPVRIRAHAFGDNRPSRDLVLSPGHAVCLDLLGEVLVPANALVNGATIVRDTVNTVTYWHVELDSHDILLAEGLPAESYLDAGNRAFFAENDVVDLDLTPDDRPAHADFCRPFHEDGVLVDAARAQLRRRAEALGWRLETPEPFADTHLMVDGRIVQLDRLGLIGCFLLPATAQEVWLITPTNTPRDAAMGLDQRDLGLSLSRLALDDGLHAVREIALDDSRMVDGFHIAEVDHRWTGGRARIPADLWAGLIGTVRLRLDLRGPSLPRWVVTPEAMSTAGSEDQVA
ncbi:Hint domain-containing protein [Methylobacterium sp. ap11]|uniref:Hint domain-containing protein n=1 Tax=Methylobacterium sp. ap11 TaxID=1761799 RepID=UPI0015A53DD5|nr:Hint domain-containing protein [Methylobacterium sp. ap11]